MNELLETLVVTENTVLPARGQLSERLVIRSSHITIDGNGTTLIGPAQKGNLDSFENAGVAILLEGCTNVVIKNLHAKGFEIGIEMIDCIACSIEGCDFSDNYDNPAFGWGELPARGGIIVTRCRYCVYKSNKACDVWDGIHLHDSDDNMILNNNLSHCTNVCAKLWNASRNVFIENDLSYGIRIDRAAGEVHARDSSGVLIESGSNDNKWYRNDVTYGGDGIFLRPLNLWPSTGNIFIENDTSYGNNNCIESWTPGTVYIRNKANHGSYGFWLGGSDQTVLIGNQANENGLTDGFHNAPEPIFAHGGIVLVGAAGSHVLVEGNECIGNNGGGIVFRGDVKSEGADWSIRHWIVQQNVLEGNKWSLHGQFADDIFLSGVKEPELKGVTNLLTSSVTSQNRAPKIVLDAPSIAQVGVPIRLSATGSKGYSENEIRYLWTIGESRCEGPEFETIMTNPGLTRVSLTVTDGVLASMAWRDLVVVEEPFEEVATEGSASRWRGNDDTIRVTNDPNALVGRYSTRIDAKPLEERLPEVQIEGLDFEIGENSKLTFWIKALNTNVFAWQREEWTVTLIGDGGETRYVPTDKAKPAHASNSEARLGWRRIEVPLAGNDLWLATVDGEPNQVIKAMKFAFDSTGTDPFTIWIDGLQLIR
jgi:parallel beta-helix repeat protein